METQKATEDKYKRCKMREREAIQLLRDATHKLESLQNNLKQEKLKSANLLLRNEALEEQISMNHTRIEDLIREKNSL